MNSSTCRPHWPDSTGWWWAFDDVCIMAERPTALHAEPIPGSAQGARRLHHSDSPALEFADGTKAFVLHGAIVPDWVVLDPTAERIAHERNVEIRRCAIERIGWDSYIELAGLTLVDQADDPGNAGACCSSTRHRRAGVEVDGFSSRSTVLSNATGIGVDTAFT